MLRPLSALALCAAISAKGSDWVNLTVYRTTPINYTGLTNMDSGDARGDVYFGLAQLVLPPLCEMDPGFLWCQNRKYLSDGASHMVYTEFVVETRRAFGDYQPCNPDLETGIFACDMGSGSKSPPPPPQCNANGNMAYFEDGLNGTVYRTLQADEGDCCTACSNDGTKCRGWTMPKPGSDICQLLQEPLVQWDDAKSKHGIRSGEHEQGGHGWSQPCWYDDPDYNNTPAFLDNCDRSQCKCRAIERLSMGRELSAMCWHHHNTEPPPSSSRLGRGAGVPRAPVALSSLAHSFNSAAHITSTSMLSTASPVNPQWWTCSGAVYDQCYQTLTESSSLECESCVNGHFAHLMKAGCTDKTAALAICHANNVTCPKAVAKACPGLLHTGGKDTLACQNCARSSQEVAHAGCTSWLVNNACYSGDDDNNEWSEYISKLACLMNGTWYSTQAPGLCEPGQTENCWWRIAATKRTVNQTCVDDRVIEAVRKARGDSCWQGCGSQANNRTSPCWIRCVFNTIFGSTGVSGAAQAPMTADEIAQPFVQAFAADGGCPSVPVPPPMA